MQSPRIVFFGGEPMGVTVLETLKSAGYLPVLIVCNPDRPQGRKMIVTPPPVKVWAQDHGIPTFQPESLKDEMTKTTLENVEADIFIVVAYGKIIPQEILDIPKFKTLNVHPSLLPKLRGASPIRSALLKDMNPTGVSIMVLTAGMDEGPLLAQKVVHIPKEEWPLRGGELDLILSKKGGELLAETIPKWIEGKITPEEQDHENATYTTKITKEMGCINLSDPAYTNLSKIRAFDGWPGTYFFHDKNGQSVRIKIVDAHVADEKLVITRIIPEGKKEISFAEYFGSH